MLIHLYKDHGDSGVLKLFNEMHSLEFDDALINDYLADLCEGNVNDSLIDWIDDLHEEIEDNDERKERHELLSLMQFAGESLVTDAYGNLICKAGDEEGVLYVEVDLKESSDLRNKKPYTQLRRTEDYL